MSCVFGVSLGNSTACVACYKDGRTDVIANDAGDRATCTSVYISSTEKVVGLRTGWNVSRANATIMRNKEFLDCDLDQESFDSIRSSEAVKAVREGSTAVYKVPDGDTVISMTPYEVATIIFEKLYSIGQSVVGDVRLDCVISVPHHYSGVSRAQVKSSAEKAGWNVVQVISEPVAALLPYLSPATGVRPPNMIALVYRIGGYSCEATVVKVISGYYKVEGSERGEVGVRSIVDSVAKHLAEEFRRKTKLEASDSRKCMWKLWTASETTVRSLSTLATSSLCLESLCDGVDFTASLSRARLESLVSPLLQIYTKPIHNLLESLHLQPSQIDKVIMVGGGVNIPCVRKEVKRIFSCGGDRETEICDWIQPQEVTAIGAASQGGFISTAFSPADSLPNQINSRTLQLNLLTSPVFLKLSTGEEVKLEGALPITKSLRVELQENESSLTVEASQTNLTANAKFEGFDCERTPLLVNLELNEKSFDVSVVDLTTNASQMSPLVLAA